MEVFEALENRHSVRKFRPVAPSQATIERILEAANWAPSAKNGQQWRFYVLQDEKKDAVASLMLERATEFERLRSEERRVG